MFQNDVVRLNLMKVLEEEIDDQMQEAQELLEGVMLLLAFEQAKYQDL